jgi:peptidoglycan/xylan/chitin deacetylase (PgdA/CDA1 family)
MAARIFIRNDDVWTLDREFRFFFDLAIDRGLPVVHAVIPGKMDQDLIRFLCRAREKMPHLLDIVQHGWMHTNHSVKAGTKYEFGASRTLQSQREDIMQGKKKMYLAFGEQFVPAFVPPYHGYDEQTLQVLDEGGFKIFSAGTRRLSGKHPFLNLPAGVSFTHYGTDGTKTVRNSADMIRRLAMAISSGPLTGVLTHHADFKTAASRKELEGFFDFIAALRDRKQCSVFLFGDFQRK